MSSSRTIRSSVLALAVTSLLCSGCATKDLADYPADHWPERVVGSNCARISGTYEDRTADIWPTNAMRGSNANDRASLAQLLAAVTPGSRPQDFLAVDRVEIDVSAMQATMLGTPADVVSLSGWTCTADGALVASSRNRANAELTFNSHVEIRFELRQAVDHSLILHSFEQFSGWLSGNKLRESWFRFPPAASVPKPASN